MLEKRKLGIGEASRGNHHRAFGLMCLISYAFFVSGEKLIKYIGENGYPNDGLDPGRHRHADARRGHSWRRAGVQINPVDRERHPGRAAWRERRCEGLRFWIARAPSSTIVFCASRKDSGSHRRAGSRSRKDTTILPELEKAHNFRVAGKTPLTDMPAHVRFLGEVADNVLEAGRAFIKSHAEAGESEAETPLAGSTNTAGSLGGNWPLPAWRFVECAFAVRQLVRKLALGQKSTADRLHESRVGNESLAGAFVRVDESDL